MAQQYKPSNQAKAQPVAGYAHNLPKGAPPVPTFLPAKAPPPATTSVTRAAAPPRAGGELTRRVADAGDYSRAYAQARAQQAAGPPAYRPGARPGGAPPTGAPPMTRGTIFGPAGAGAPAQGLPQAMLPPPEDALLGQLAMARAQQPSRQELTQLPDFPQYEPLYGESGQEMPDTQEEGGTTPQKETGPFPEGMTEEEWDAKVAEAVEKYKSLYGEKDLQQLDELIQRYQAGETLSPGEYNVLQEIGLMGSEDILAAAKDKISKGDYLLTSDEYEAMHAAGELATPEGHKWEYNGETKAWEMRQMTEDEYLDYQMDEVFKDMADDTKFYNSLDAYAAQMKRSMAEASFMAGGQMQSAGLWSTGLTPRHMMQVESKGLAEMSATMSDMIVQHQQQKWQAKLQWLQGKTSLWAQRKTLELQATVASFNAAMQGADTMMAWLDAEGLGDYADEYWKAVEACNELTHSESLKCVWSLYGGFGVDHEGNLRWGIKSPEEIYDIAAKKEAKAVQKCGSCWDPHNWSCCLEQSDADDDFEHTAPNPASGKAYKAGGKPMYA